MKKKFHVFFLFTLIALLSANAAFAATVTFQTDENGDKYVNLPSSGTDEINIAADVTSFYVYDDGGKDGDYSEISHGSLVLTAPEGYVFILSGWLYAYFGGSLTIYDGNTSEKKLLDGATDYLDIYVGSSKNVITLKFDGRDYAPFDGFELKVSVVKRVEHSIAYADNIVGGTINKEKKTAFSGENLTFEVTPDDGFLLDGFDIFDENGKLVNVLNNKWYSGKTATFVMPFSNITVEPKFIAKDNLYINMKGYIEAVIPKGVTSFKVYDDGGKDGTYGAGYHFMRLYSLGGALQVTGQMATCDDADYLQFLDLYGQYGWYNEEKIVENIGPFSEIGGISFNVNSGNCEDGAYGFELTVNVVSPEVTVVNPSTEEGTVSVGTTTTFETGSTVTMTTQLNDYDYMLNNFVLTSQQGYPVRIDANISWGSNTSTFTMPNMNVYVHPSFIKKSEEIYINMPAYGNMNLTLSEEFLKDVKSFKVYDDGGKDGEYDGGSVDGTLQLIAPKGYIFRVTGNITGYNHITKLKISDGNRILDMPCRNFDETDIGTFYSSDETMTIRFQSESGYVMLDGLDLTVEVIKRIEYTIASYESDNNGSVTVQNSALPGDIVELTAHPKDGYLLNGVVVKSLTDGKSVEVDGGSWYSDNLASFFMPASNVEVYSLFTNKFTAEGGLFVNLPTVGTKTANIPQNVKSFSVYDDGGKDGEHTRGADGCLVLNAPQNYVLQVKGTTDIHTYLHNTDQLTIYDGNSNDSKLFESTKGQNAVGTLTSADNVMTMCFRTDDSWETSGFDLTVSVAENINHSITYVDGVAGGSISGVDKALPGKVIEMTATPPKGEVLNSVEVVDEYQNAVDAEGTWYSNNLASFVMPGSNVHVKPVFAEPTADGGLYINMPKTGRKEIVVPANVRSFKVYDDGGVNGKYSKYADGYLRLTAPQGCLLQINGTLNTYAKSNYGTSDSLFIYDSNNENILKVSKADNFQIGPLTNPERELTFYFKSDYDFSESGLDLTVELIAPPVLIFSATGGSMTADNYYATDGETVTLTATPDEGYLFDGVKIEDADGQKVMLVSSFDPDGKPISYMDDVHWYYDINTAKFIMPSSAVTVTPVFTKLSDLYVNMPKNRTIEVHIPESVASFKVYDDGGDTGNYSDEANGTLELIPTDGWTLNVAGKAALMSGDVFKIQSSVMVTPKEGTPYLLYLDDFYENNGSSDGTEVDIEPQTVSQVAVVSLVSDVAGNAAGINLTVTKVRTTFGAVGVAYVKGYFWGNLYGGHEKVAVIDSAYNGTDAVSITDDIEVDTVIYNRKFIKDTYSTMVLPFSVRTKNVSGIDAVLYYNGIGTDKDGNDAVRMKVLWAADGVIKDDKGNSVSYKDTVMKANTPYLVQMNSETFQVEGGVTIVPTTEAVTKYDDWEWEFRGVWQYKKWEKGNKELGYAYGFAASAPENSNIKVGDFVKIGEGTYIYPLRAYLVSTNIPESSSPVQGVRANGAYVKRPTVKQKELPELMSVIVDSEDGNEEHTTVIGQFNTRTGEFKMNNAATKRVFDVKGRNVGNKANKARGAYYGKKVR